MYSPTPTNYHILKHIARLPTPQIEVKIRRHTAAIAAEPTDTPNRRFHERRLDISRMVLAARGD